MNKITAKVHSARNITAKTDVHVEPPILQAKSATPTKKEQVVTPDEGYNGLSSVTIEGITADSTVTYSFWACAVDYDGTELALVENMENGDTFTLPTPPEHPRLEFRGWSATDTIVDNTITIDRNNFLAGAMYVTKSGATELDVRLTERTGLTITFTNALTYTQVDWGDGTVDTATTHTYADYGEYTIKLYNAENANIAAIFGQNSAAKDYALIRFYSDENLTTFYSYLFNYCMNLEYVTLSPNLSKYTSSSAQYLFFSNKMRGLVLPPNFYGSKLISVQPCMDYLVAPIGYDDGRLPLKRNAYSMSATHISGALYDYGLQDIVITARSTSSGAFYPTMKRVLLRTPVIFSSVFPNNRAIEIFCAFEPRACGGGTANSYYNCGTQNATIFMSQDNGYTFYKLKDMVISDKASISNKCFSSWSCLESVVISSGTTSIGAEAFLACSSLRSVSLPDTLTTIGNEAFRGCYSLEHIVFPDTLTSIGQYAFCNDVNLGGDIVIPNGVKTLNQSVFYDCKLSSIKCLGAITSIGSSALAVNSTLRFVDLSACTSVPTLASSSTINKERLEAIIVPDALYDTWVTATNWTALSQYIKKASEVQL